MARATGTAPGEVRGRAGGRRGPRANAQRQRPGAGGEGPAELGAEGGGASPRILRLRLLERRGRRGPSRSPEDNESRLAIGARGPKREGRELEAPPRPPRLGRPSKLLSRLHPRVPERGRHAPTAPPPAGSPAGAHFQLRPHPAASGPVRRMGSTRPLLCVSGVPTTSRQHRRGSGDRRPSLRAPRSPQTVGKRSGLLPRPVSGSQLAAERSSNLGIPEPIVGNCAGPSSRSPSGMPCRRGGALLLREVREARSRRTGVRAGRRAGAWGVCLGRARPRRLQGKLSRQSEGWRPARAQPRCSWAGPGRQQKAPERSDSQAAGKGAPLLGGVAAGGGGRSGGGLMAKC